MQARPIHRGIPPLSPLGRRAALGAALSLALLGGCTSVGADLPPMPEETAGPYRLGAGDQVRVTVFNDPRLTGDFRVGDTGSLALPLVGLVPVQGRTTEQAARQIEEALRSRDLFNDPSVALEILTYRPVFVLGMVERGGQTPYQPGMTVLSAVATVGGFNYRAVTSYVGLTRIGEDGQAHEYRAGRSALLQPGDVVNVFERRF
ncbi:polysaccharide biosynthesis/export family protein [Pseudoroseomonas ludipueritiae]|uniref:Polysaccharide export protein n=1 Tax=Pseudoroseomonas ludipueritiae TaxID=198093 RepID=A0ABR7R5J9_9PROT|nr:polysaccharide biosynthesis/export family protein [Pseudoroseomonas ludipueritiae]MBC9176937.1 polysaccharide export protein [Pseudoroseomonas ludipueritiae]MCG7361539.1 polysaccharide export protein [Roseomonas sp. ACRSG]